jgi:alpha-D-xyloside xylohydrolase
MKFTDGNWMMRKGVRAFYPAQAYDVETGADALTIYAPTKTIRHRGDTLEGPLLTVRFASPLPDVICVRLSHFSGVQSPGPHFPLFASQNDTQSQEVSVQDGEDAATLTSGRLSARIARTGGWGVEFLADGRTITKSGPRGMGYADVEGDGPYLHEQLSLGVGETVYGLGERFTAFVKNGQVVETWNKDGGTGSDQAYKNVPFYLTNRGYGVFVNHPEEVSFEVASEKVSRVQFSVSGQSLEYFVIYGPTPKEILAKYTALTGRPALPPAWSFGLWLTTSFTTSYDEQTVTGFIQGMADRDLPLHVFHFDCFWMREFRWCDFEWDPRTFPDPPAMLQRLKERGLHICVWINPYIAQLSALFAEGKRGGYLLKKPNGDVWQTDQWQAGMGIVDFTNPDACKWFGAKLRALLDMGVDSFKTDFGERIPTDVAYFDGSDPRKMHNFYSYLYNKVVFDVLQEARGEGEAALFARSATAGCQQFPVHWGGDCYSSFESMAESLRGGLSLCLSGFGFWSHDIGGFEGMPPAEVYKRWIAFGLLSSHSRLHGSSSYRVPWQFDEEAVDTLRFFTKLKCRLMPYLFAQAVEAHRTGVPVMRAMLLEFPDDPACAYLDRQYLLGDALLVAPVFAANGVVDYYVPAGRWTNFFTGETVIGPRWVRETHGFLSVPLLARPNSLVAVGSQTDRPDYDYSEDITFHLYALEEGQEASAIVPTLKGEDALTVTARRTGSRIHLAAQDAENEKTENRKTWKVLLVGIDSVASVEGGTLEPTTGGTRITPTPGAAQMTITLDS